MAELAETYWYSNPDTSFSIAQQGFVFSRQIKFVKGEANCLRNMGVILDLRGNYPAALEHYLEALKKYESLNDQEGMLKIYADLGAVYNEQRDYNIAISFTLKTLLILKSYHNRVPNYNYLLQFSYKLQPIRINSNLI